MHRPTKRDDTVRPFFVLARPGGANRRSDQGDPGVTPRRLRGTDVVYRRNVGPGRISEGKLVNVVFERGDEYPQRSLTVTSSASDARLFLEAGRDTGRGVESYAVRLAVAGLNADTGVYTLGDDGLPAYFAALAQDWRGWSGSRGWSSLEGQFSLDSEHDGLGTITMIAGLAPDAAFPRWKAAIVLTVDAGGLEHAAGAVTRFFA